MVCVTDLPQRIDLPASRIGSSIVEMNTQVKAFILLENKPMFFKLDFTSP